MPAPLYATSPEELLTPAQLAEMSGYEFLLAIKEGRLPAPPIAEPMGMRLVEVAKGRVVFEGTPAFRHYNPLGGVHGGWYGTLMDSCTSCAVQTLLPKGQGYTTLEYKVNMIRGATVETGPLSAIGEAIRVGRRTGVAEGRLVDGTGRVYATCLTTCLVMEIG